MSFRINNKIQLPKQNLFFGDTLITERSFVFFLKEKADKKTRGNVLFKSQD
jgi:hypothetical protein